MLLDRKERTGWLIIFTGGGIAKDADQCGPVDGVNSWGVADGFTKGGKPEKTLRYWDQLQQLYAHKVESSRTEL